ncbi:MAG TPA: M50 family metallopeptidase [Gaiellaceae bacterium]
MSLVAAILGLAVLVLIHEAGHFFAARAVGMTPRKFYLGFGPPLISRTRNGVEYAIAAFPLGGYVKIPGMNRPSPGDLRGSLKPDAQVEYARELARLDGALEQGNESAARAALEELRPELGTTRMWQEQEMALAPDAYWRQATWKRLVAIGAGPAVNLLFGIVLFMCLFLVASTRDTNVVGAVQPRSPAAAAHIKKGDKILAVAGTRVKPKDIPAHIRSTLGQPFTLVVERSGRRVTVGPLRARITGGAYRIGVAIEQRTGAGESPPAAIRDSFKLTWSVTSDTVTGLGRLATGHDTNQVSSTVGIVKVSSAAWRQGLRDFLFVVGLISLALGLLNLIPVLPLDGGHILIALVEKLRGRTFAQAVYIRYSLVGLSLFAILMYFGLRNDLFGGGG